MDKFLLGILVGVVPAVLMLMVYIISLAARFARIENDICLLKKYIE
ncbi:hypothetical protein ES703_70757 [subsurface metagenome]